MGADVAPALVGVGYIVNLHIASLVFIGGVLGWFVGIPLLGTPAEFADLGALDLSWELWSSQIRYIGVGAMIVGGVWSIFSVRKGIASGLREVKATYKGGVVLPEAETNMSFMSMAIIMMLCF